MKQLILIIGAPGSGKTTDAELISKKHSDTIVHYSTGDLFRAEVASGSELGKEIDKYVSKGNLVPIDIVIKTVVGAVNQAPKDIVIIDGFPRSIEQKLELDKFLSSEDNVKLISVIEVEVSKDVARDRVLGRARGADDNDEVFDNRMKVYLEPLDEIKKFYTNKNILKTIDGERTIQEIVDEIDEYIHSII
jgi:adenylate kinase